MIYIYYCEADEMAQRESHNLLRCAAGYRYGAGNYEIEKRPGGKPYFAAHPDICFSISHSGDYWMCAFADSEIGLDIQRVKKCSRRKISERFFHTDECTYLEHTDYESFFDVWAAKEAYLKYTGAGIVHGMDQESVVQGGRIRESVNGARLQKIEFGASIPGEPDNEYKIWLCLGPGSGRDSLAERSSAEDPEAWGLQGSIDYEIIDLKGMVF